MNTFGRQGLRVLALLANCVALGGAASDGGEDETENAGGAATGAVPYKIKLKSTDSNEAKVFLSAFGQGLEDIVGRDIRDGMSGVSSNDELGKHIYKTRRNDG